MGELYPRSLTLAKTNTCPNGMKLFISASRQFRSYFLHKVCNLSDKVPDWAWLYVSHLAGTLHPGIVTSQSEESINMQRPMGTVLGKFWRLPFLHSVRWEQGRYLQSAPWTAVEITVNVMNNNL